MNNRIKKIYSIIKQRKKNKIDFSIYSNNLFSYIQALAFSRSENFKKRSIELHTPLGSRDYGDGLKGNPLWKYFQQNLEGPGIWKWKHYFEIYERHFERFRLREPTVMEVGVYSGGSLGMWLDYFGPGSSVVGIDIEPGVKVYESENISIHIGDQEDRQFWRGLQRIVSNIDVFIDDGGHTPNQQITTIEEVLPYMKPGSVYVCEDIEGVDNTVIGFIGGLISALFSRAEESQSSGFQSQVHSLHVYPFCVVIEKHKDNLIEFQSIRKGSEWQPFLGVN